MRFVTPAFRWLTALFLHFSIFFVIGAFCFVFLLGNSQTVKDALVDSGIYNEFVDSVIDANLEESQQDANALPLEDENVRRIVNQAFAPQELRKQTEAVIDDVYTWLDGSAADLTFMFDFTGSKNSMNNGIAIYAADRVLSLPECSVPLTEVNVFTVDCRPAGFSFEFVRAQVLGDLESSSFLESTTITQDNLPLTADGKTIEQRYSFAPSVFQFLNGSIAISIAAALLGAVLFVYVRRPLSRGFQALGRDLLSNSVMLIIFTIVFGFLIPRYTDSFGIQGNETSKLFNEAVNIYIQRLDVIIINVAIQIAAVGLGIILIARVNKAAGGYREARAKSGLITSIAAKKSKQSSGKRRSRPPIQSSEASKRKSASRKKKRKISRPGA